VGVPVAQDRVPVRLPNGDTPQIPSIPLDSRRAGHYGCLMESETHRAGDTVESVEREGNGMDTDSNDGVTAYRHAEMRYRELLNHYNAEHVDAESGGVKVAGIKADTLRAIHSDHHEAMDLDHSHGSTDQGIRNARAEALAEAQSALAGALAHMETVTGLLADWNAAPNVKTFTDADSFGLEVSRANYWDRVTADACAIEQRLLTLTADVGNLR
jgi:hypothetical protein